MIRAAALVAALLVLLASCGGSGGRGPSVAGVITPAPATLRTDLLFGYYGQSSATALETEDHANLFWAPDFYGPLEQMAGLTQAKAAGLKAVVAIPLCLVPVAQGESEARTWLQRLHDAGLLGPVVAVSWCDEPNTAHGGGWSDEDAAAMSAAVRSAMATFPELHAGLAVVYACRGDYPGAGSFDWIGCDDYDSGCGALTTFYPGLPLKGAQRLMVLPGGADPWRQDPACFLSFAERDPRVVAIVPFIWQTVPGNAGIRENGMRAIYCQAGRTVVAHGASAGGCP